MHGLYVASCTKNLIRFDDVLEKLDQERLSMFWLQLVAQCGEYAEAFQGTLVEHADRKTVEKIFVVLKLLDPSAYVHSPPFSYSC